jgi:DNA-binding beta-propeller fold protein YncE
VVGLLLGIGAGCAEEYRGKPPLTGALHYPLSLAVDEGSGTLFVVNTNFNLAYEMASILTVDVATGDFGDPYVTVESFPGDLLLVHRTDDLAFGYIPVRGNNSLTWFEIDRKAKGSLEMLCNEARDVLDPRCRGRYVVTRGMVAVPDSDDQQNLTLGSDPYGQAWIPGRLGQKDLLVVAAMRSGRISLFELQEDGEPVLVDQRTLLSGIHSLAADPAGELIYVTNKSYPVVHRLQVRRTLTSTTLEIVDAATLPAPFTTGDFGRGIAFARGGKTVLVAHRNPAALVALDASLRPGQFGGTPTQVTPVGRRPASVMVVPSGPEGSERVYVSCFDDDRVWVLDPQTMLALESIWVGEGPYAMAALVNDTTKKGFVSNFLDNTVSVIDLDSGSDTYHTVIGEIQ